MQLLRAMVRGEPGVVLSANLLGIFERTEGCRRMNLSRRPSFCPKSGGVTLFLLIYDIMLFVKLVLGLGPGRLRARAANVRTGEAAGQPDAATHEPPSSDPRRRHPTGRRPPPHAKRSTRAEPNGAQVKGETYLSKKIIIPNFKTIYGYRSLV